MAFNNPDELHESLEESGILNLAALENMVILEFKRWVRDNPDESTNPMTRSDVCSDIAMDYLPEAPRFCLVYLKDKPELGNTIPAAEAEMGNPDGDGVSAWGVLRYNLQLHLTDVLMAVKI